MKQDPKNYSMFLVKLWISFVLIWFWVNQIISTEDFMWYLPNFILNSEYAYYFVLFNGIFEFIWWCLLLFNKFTKVLSILFWLHFLSIIITLGYNDIAIRDVWLMFATFSLFFNNWKLWKK